VGCLIEILIDIGRDIGGFLLIVMLFYLFIMLPMNYHSEWSDRRWMRKQSEEARRLREDKAIKC
jgi:hypothetical protein